jgi:hypothetical protein
MPRLLRTVVITFCVAAAPAWAAHQHTHRLPVGDCSLANIPDDPAHGHVGGKDFKLGGATLLQTSAAAGGANYDNYLLTLATPDGAGATMTIVVTASVPQGQTLDGKTFRRTIEKDVAKQPQAGPGQAQIPDWGIDYASPLVDLDSVAGTASIKLQFGTRTGTTLPAKIYFCAPDASANVFLGKFSVDTAN